MAPPIKNPLRKVVTENEIQTGRIPIPAKVRDHLFPHLLQNTKTALTMIDETGDQHDVVLKLRANRTKPEIMSKGGKRFAEKRLSVYDALDFSRGESLDIIKVEVKKWLKLAPPNPSSPIEIDLSVDEPQAVTVPELENPSMETLLPDLSSSIGSVYGKLRSHVAPAVEINGIDSSGSRRLGKTPISKHDGARV